MTSKLEHYVDRIFADGGTMSEFFPNYQPRDPQIRMAEAVCRCLLDGRHGLLEAGTGTGKSLGYAVAAALWAAVYEKKIVLSTFTVTLQNQLVYKDLPLVRRILDRLGLSFNYELAKGRSHYICKRRLHEALSFHQATGSDHFEGLASLSLRVDDLAVGDRSELEEDAPFWDDINGDSNDCLGDQSPHYDNCFIQQARARLKAADVIVSNHALFFADFNMRERGMYGLFPDYDAVIFDEGHRIEDVFSNFFKKQASVKVVEQLFDRVLLKQSAWSGKVLDDPEVGEEYETTIRQLRTAGVRVATGMFQQLADRMIQLQSSSELLQAKLLDSNPMTRVLQGFLDQMELIQEQRDWDKPVERGIENMCESIARLRDDFSHLLFNEDAERWANWIELRAARTSSELLPEFEAAYRLHLSGAPIQASTVLEKTLFATKTVILTSATLSTSGTFDYMATRLGMSDYEAFQVDSPFDYPNQSLLVVPGNAVSPKKSELFEPYAIGAIKQALEITQGRTFILFTSYAQMTRMHDELLPWMQERQLAPFLHSKQTSREVLLKNFKASERGVLFGAESFWEGVDVPGGDLVCVIIVKLPFFVPSEPIVKARCQRIRDRGGDDFAEYMLPNTILRIKQGFGRLIRTVTDRGACIILDSRVLASGFGKQILASLPAAPVSKRIDAIRPYVQEASEEMLIK
ncbi:ATP-dependent DNA helicase [Paenibacillus pasadenensis]|uniref:ATP-dependent DNA helicase n=1 Tax=Paenibacillus pasadenensis TaxID=217090 RepID=UPI0004069A8A|nr:helicase C-terminal domain-containing protein [Paenibacillus pasadenensis]